MKRLIDYYLTQWKSDTYRKPLLLRGARQVGKTHAARQLGSTFLEFVEVNLEFLPEVHGVFEKDLDPERIIRELSLITRKPITPGKTLLFLDEVQASPKALLSLRYFYEMMPELHVIAAGSLMDFAIEKVGIPVGRVDSLYMYPLSFIEFLAAIKEHLLIEEVIMHDVHKTMSEVIHKKLLHLLGEYLAFGGMPAVLKCWQEIRDPLQCAKIHSSLIDTYRQDFEKYARKLQIKYVELIFDQIPIQLGTKFRFSAIEGEYRKRELAPALNLLSIAGIAHKIFHSAGHGIPLGAQIDPSDYKVIFLDVGLAQSILDFDISGWFLNPLNEFANKGSLIEAFVGQEIIAYAHPSRKHNLFFWNRKTRSSQAEVDYLIQLDQNIVPVEVKSGMGRTLKSINLFLESHPNSSYGIRFSTLNYSQHEKIHSYPLYAIAKVTQHQNLKEALKIVSS